MNAEVAIGLAALVINALLLAVGYGVLKGTVAALAARVMTLEGELNAFAELKVEVARIGERQEMWIEQLKELNASIRWMRNPAEYEPTAAVRPTPRRKRDTP